MDAKTRGALRRMNRRRRLRWRDEVRLEWRLITIERALARLELATEERGQAPEIQQALHDILNIYGNTGQLVEVAHSQREQIQALVDAYTRLSLSLEIHHSTSNTDRAAIKELMSAMHIMLGSLIALARSQIRHLNDIGRAVGADQAESELRRLQDVDARDRRPEEK